MDDINGRVAKFVQNELSSEERSAFLSEAELDPHLQKLVEEYSAVHGLASKISESKSMLAESVSDSIMAQINNKQISEQSFIKSWKLVPQTFGALSVLFLTVLIIGGNELPSPNFCNSFGQDPSVNFMNGFLQGDLTIGLIATLFIFSLGAAFYSRYVVAFIVVLVSLTLWAGRVESKACIVGKQTPTNSTTSK